MMSRAGTPSASHAKQALLQAPTASPKSLTLQCSSSTGHVTHVPNVGWLQKVPAPQTPPEDAQTSSSTAAFRRSAVVRSPCLVAGWLVHAWGGGGVSGGGSKMRGDNGDATNNNRREHTCGGDWVGKGDRAGVGHGDVRGSLYFGRLLRMSEGGHEKDSYVEGVHLFERRQRREDKTGEQRETWVASARCYSQHCVVTGTTTRDALYLQYLIG